MLKLSHAAGQIKKKSNCVVHVKYFQKLINLSMNIYKMNDNKRIAAHTTRIF